MFYSTKLIQELSIRDFLKCPAVAAHFQDRLANILDSVHISRYERLPPSYSNKEIQQILLKIDRKSPEGKMDYAAIILAVELGLRVSDIRKLQLTEIIWALLDKSTRPSPYTYWACIGKIELTKKEWMSIWQFH